MKINTVLFVSLKISILILAGCASYKPNTFDNQTKRYNDYKNNYSIEILDKYSLLSSEAKGILQGAYLKNAPADSAIFFDRKTESTVLMGVFGRVSLPLKSKNEKEAYLSILLDDLKEKIKGKGEAIEIKALSAENTKSIEVSSTSEFGETKCIFRFGLFPESKISQDLKIYLLNSCTKPNYFDEIKEDHIKMSSTLLLPAFSETERKLNSSTPSQLSKEISKPASNSPGWPPENIMKEIKRKCVSDFPSDYANQADCVKRQEAGWLELNR
jgi:hypothetical protein